MLCVPVDEEIPEVSDSVVKAITGESARMVLFCLLVATLVFFLPSSFLPSCFVYLRYH